MAYTPTYTTYAFVHRIDGIIYYTAYESEECKTYGLE